VLAYDTQIAAFVKYAGWSGILLASAWVIWRFFLCVWLKNSGRAVDRMA